MRALKGGDHQPLPGLDADVVPGSTRPVELRGELAHHGVKAGVLLRGALAQRGAAQRGQRSTRMAVGFTT
jgi:hypothetical protein